MKNPISLKNFNEFKNVYDNGKSLANRMIVMYVLENNKGYNRLGISAGKKFGNSIVRHRFARLVRESFRKEEDLLKKGLDMIIIMRAGAVDAKMQDIAEAMESLARRHDIIQEK